MIDTNQNQGRSIHLIPLPLPVLRYHCPCGRENTISPSYCGIHRGEVCPDCMARNDVLVWLDNALQAGAIVTHTSPAPFPFQAPA